MTFKPVILRAQAQRDIESAITYYAVEADADVALRFVDNLAQAYRAISSRPATGSPRYAQELDLPGLRSRNVKRFPYTIFYIERVDHIDLWRVLHSQRDIPAWFGEVHQA